ncbi:GlmU family protein [candidate division KSB1 bacterium]|nr:GlmU family protein [candidate division KSB1 bacterium]
MTPTFCLFEDERSAQFYPLSLTRPVFDLRCGMTSLREKIARQFPQTQLFLFCREYLADSMREANPECRVNELPKEPSWFVNGGFLFSASLPRNLQKELLCKHNGKTVAAFIKPERLAIVDQSLKLPESLSGIAEHEVEGTWLNYPWDLVHANAKAIARDFAFYKRGGQSLGKIYPNVTLLDEQNIFIAPSAKVKPGVVLDAEEGPIYIDEGATIMANASLQGPVYVGKNSTIKMGAKIYEGTSIGEVCKVGGEVEESIIHGYSNKQHEGFLGHAYLGEWVNLGADTNNSDLKNNYGTVKVYINGQSVDSGSLFVGLFMGDHAKTGINTMFNTGTVVGVMSNVFGPGYPSKAMPSFAWGGVPALETYALEKALATARRVMARRKRELTEAQEKVLRHVFAMTEAERQSAVFMQ